MISELEAWHDFPLSVVRREDSALEGAARTHFGSLAKAAKAAGLEPRGWKWSKQEVIEAIQDRHVKGMHLRNVKHDDVALTHAARKYFGSWYNACVAAGFPQATDDPTIQNRWTKSDVLEAIMSRHRQGGSMATAWKEDNSLYEAAKTHFGGWRRALATLGIDSTYRRQWSKQDLIDEIVLRREQGLPLSSGWPGNRRLAAAAKRHFGSWTAALAAANVTA